LPDELKFRSCLTLFREAASDKSDRLLFEETLKQFYNGDAPFIAESLSLPAKT
jgi:uncharacterized protein (DUF1810 family)